ncbi:hypothetical protein DL98DRAFT_583566 [Cadophora sp. DSE1049]|nr:hypothetical protein DL98DRAFT_583566 [Cadophora sp. DSE1049]
MVVKEKVVKEEVDNIERARRVMLVALSAHQVRVGCVFSGWCLEFEDLLTTVIDTQVQINSGSDADAEASKHNSPPATISSTKKVSPSKRKPVEVTVKTYWYFAKVQEICTRWSKQEDFLPKDIEIIRNFYPPTWLGVPGISKREARIYGQWQTPLHLTAHCRSWYPYPTVPADDLVNDTDTANRPSDIVDTIRTLVGSGQCDPMNTSPLVYGRSLNHWHNQETALHIYNGPFEGLQYLIQQENFPVDLQFKDGHGLCMASRLIDDTFNDS